MKWEITAILVTKILPVFLEAYSSLLFACKIKKNILRGSMDT